MAGVEDRKLVTVKQAAELTNVSTRTVQSWITQGRIEAIYTVTGYPRIYLDTLFQQTRQPPIGQRHVFHKETK